MLRVCWLLPPRHSRGELSRTRTEAPDSRAVRAATSAALPPPTTTRSYSREKGSKGRKVRWEPVDCIHSNTRTRVASVACAARDPGTRSKTTEERDMNCTRRLLLVAALAAALPAAA